MPNATYDILIKFTLDAAAAKEAVDRMADLRKAAQAGPGYGTSATVAMPGQTRGADIPPVERNARRKPRAAALDAAPSDLPPIEHAARAAAVPIQNVPTEAPAPAKPLPEVTPASAVPVIPAPVTPTPEAPVAPITPAAVSSSTTAESDTKRDSIPTTPTSIREIYEILVKFSVDDAGARAALDRFDDMEQSAKRASVPGVYNISVPFFGGAASAAEGKETPTETATRATPRSQKRNPTPAASPAGAPVPASRGNRPQAAAPHQENAPAPKQEEESPEQASVNAIKRFKSSTEKWKGELNQTYETLLGSGLSKAASSKIIRDLDRTHAASSTVQKQVASTYETLRKAGFDEAAANKTISGIQKVSQAARQNNSDFERSNQLVSQFRGSLGQFSGAAASLLTVGGAIAAITGSVNNYVQQAGMSETASRKWLLATQDLDIANVQIGRTLTETILPFYEKFVGLAKQAADWAAKTKSSYDQAFSDKGPRDAGMIPEDLMLRPITTVGSIISGAYAPIGQSGDKTQPGGFEEKAQAMRDAAKVNPASAGRAYYGLTQIGRAHV
jgi:hypothetical protein